MDTNICYYIQYDPKNKQKGGTWYMSTRGAAASEQSQKMIADKGNNEEIFCLAYYEGKCPGCNGKCPTLHSDR